MNDEDRGENASPSSHDSRSRNSFPGKGLSEQQKEGLQMVKKLMFSLDQEEGLEDIYTFR